MENDRCLGCGNDQGWETGLTARLCTLCGRQEVAVGLDDWRGATEAEGAARGAGGRCGEEQGGRGGPASRSADYDSMFRALALGERDWEES